MQTHGLIGHTSPTTGNAVDRVKRAGIRTSLVLETIGRGYGPDEVHQGLMDSPGHRVNVLSPDATDVGVGLVLTPEDQRTAYVVTELFARFAKKVDIGALTNTLMTVATTPDEAASIDALLDPKARGLGLGLGLAQGTRPDTIENAIAVIALIGY